MSHICSGLPGPAAKFDAEISSRTEPDKKLNGLLNRVILTICSGNSQLFTVTEQTLSLSIFSSTHSRLYYGRAETAAPHV
jgi:hypothetical protein